MSDFSSIKIVTSITEFESLRVCWNELSDDAVYPNIFTTWEWQYFWWEWFSKNSPKKELYILLLEHENKLIGIVPFYRLNKKEIFFIGYGARPCAEYLGPIIRNGNEERFCTAVVSFLKEHQTDWGSIFFEDYAADDPGTCLLAKKLNDTFFGFSEKSDSRYFVQLPETYNDYLLQLTQHNRKRKKERLNQAKSRYAAELREISIEEFETCFDEHLVRLTSQARQRHGQQNPFLIPQYHGFHQAVCRAMLPQKRVGILVLYYNEAGLSSSNSPSIDSNRTAINGGIVSIWYIYLYHGKCAAYQQGHDVNVKGSPSDVTLQLILKYLIDNNYREFDFLRGGQWYKTTFANAERKTVSFSVFSGKNMVYQKFLFKKNVYAPFKKCVKNILSSIKSIIDRKSRVNLSNADSKTTS